MSESSVESNVEPWSRVIAQATWRFGVVLVAVGLLGPMLMQPEAAVSFASGLAGLVALVDAAGRAARGRPPWTARLVVALAWVTAALWLLGCMLQGAYVRALADAGQEAAWGHAWRIASTREIGVILALCGLVVTAVPALVIARLATPRAGERLAVASSLAIVLGGGLVLLYGVFRPDAHSAYDSSAFGAAAPCALMAVLGTIGGTFVLHLLDLIEAHHATARSLDL